MSHHTTSRNGSGPPKDYQPNHVTRLHDQAAKALLLGRTLGISGDAMLDALSGLGMKLAYSAWIAESLEAIGADDDDDDDDDIEPEPVLVKKRSRR